MSKPRVATAWLSGCAGCHMSLLDIDEKLIDLLGRADIVYSPIADIKEFPEGVDVALVEGAIANEENMELAHKIRERSGVVVSLGDCAGTGNVPSMRNSLAVKELLQSVYHEGDGFGLNGNGANILPQLLPWVLPLHQVIQVDAFIPGCPPDPERIWLAVTALLRGEPVELSADMRKFG